MNRAMACKKECKHFSMYDELRT